MTILGALIGALAIWLVIAFNRLVRAHNLVKEAWSNIDVQLKRRHDLLPKLIEVVKGYQQHEQNTQLDVATLRYQLTLGNVPVISAGENAVSTQMRGWLALAESYPDLKANENFISLQETVSEVEEAIQKARRTYNGAVRDINVLVESIPGRWIAPRVGLGALPFFELQSVIERDTSGRI